MKYINHQLITRIAHCTNVKYLSNTGWVIQTSAHEIQQFIGVSLMMGCIKMLRIRMYWANKTSVLSIRKTMSHDRYFLLRKHLKVVDDNTISEEERNDDNLWRLRPYLERIRSGCLEIPRPRDCCEDEQMIPFTGRASIRQHVKNKPNPTGLKNFVLGSPDGSVLDFEIFQGENALPGAQEDNRKKSGKFCIGSITVMRLTESLVAGNKLYFDRYFTSMALLDELLSQGILGTGTVMRRNVPAAAKVPSTIGGPRGSYHVATRGDGKLCCVNWMDNKPVLMQSTAHSDDPADVP